MTVTDTATPELERILTELKKLRSMRITIGMQGSGINWQEQHVSVEADLLTIARVHEYGAVITPKHSKNLAIPIHKDSYDKSPRDFSNLTYVPIDEGYGYLVRDRNLKRKHEGKESYKNYDWLFMLVKSVTIPERSFIRAGYDANKNQLTELVKKELHNVVYNGETAEQAAAWIGIGAVKMIRNFVLEAGNLKPKGKIQKDRYPSWADNPLVATNGLLNSLTFKVEEDG